MTRTGTIPLAVKAIIAFHLMSFLVWSVGQAGALLSYDEVAELGLQDHSSLVDPVIVQINKGIALADTILMLPLHLVAALGLVRMKFWGAIASWLVFGMTLYWPIVFWSSQHFYAEAGTLHVPTSASTVIVPAAVVTLAAWGTGYLYRNRSLFL